MKYEVESAIIPVPGTIGFAVVVDLNGGKKKRSLNRTYLSGEFNILGLDLNG